MSVHDESRYECPRCQDVHVSDACPCDCDHPELEESESEACCYSCGKCFEVVPA